MWCFSVCKTPKGVVPVFLPPAWCWWSAPLSGRSHFGCSWGFCIDRVRTSPQVQRYEFVRVALVFLVPPTPHTLSLLTVCVRMFAVCPPPRSSLVCRTPWSLANTRTGRSQPCWCTLHFYTTTSGCSARNTRSHLRRHEKKSNNDLTKKKKLKIFAFLHVSAVLPMQAMRDRSRV